MQTLYLVQAYSKEPDPRFQTHLYPTYLTSYEQNMNKLALQSGLHDALKFTNFDTANEWMRKAKQTFPTKTFEVIPADKRIFGKPTPAYMVM